MLIGFLRAGERAFFQKFMRVRGFGAARAQRALATSVSTIAHWIETENKQALRQLPGVGPRQAEQIVAELKGKVVEEALLQGRAVHCPCRRGATRAGAGSGGRGGGVDEFGLSAS